MKPGGSIPHSQRLTNNPYPEPNQPNSTHWYLSLSTNTKTNNNNDDNNNNNNMVYYDNIVFKCSKI